MTADLAADPRHEITQRVTLILEGLHGDMAPALVAADDLFGRLVASSEGGKVFRGTLLVRAFEACGGTDRDAALDLAAAVELFQTAALIHDDVLDGSDTRRGRPAAHRVFEAEHRAQGLTGSAEAYGRAAAILAGDVALVAAQHAAYAAAERVGTRVSHLFARMASLVTAGQHLDMRVAATPLEPLDELERLVRATMRSKTASYTAEFPLAMGAAAAQASPQTVEALAAAGIPLGLAFQLRDDILGVTGTESETGKPVGDDLREGKRTLLVWRALVDGSPAEIRAITATLGDGDASPEAIDAAIDAFRTSGALAWAEDEIGALAREARAALAATLPDAAPVLALVDAAVHRAA